MPHRPAHQPQMHTCAATGRLYPENQLVPLTALRPKVAETIQAEYPGLPEDAHVSTAVVNSARLDYARQVLEDQIGDLTKLDEEVVESLARHEILSERPLAEQEEDSKLTFGERIADKVAEFGGSWTFILSFGALLVIWISLNVVVFSNKGFDPYPFILLNLILSCIAALQAPIIMMSQNRLEARDRQHAENDYQVNLKAELEIRHLHEKMDYLLHQHATRLLEIQHMQLESLRELARARGSSHGHD